MVLAGAIMMVAQLALAADPPLADLTITNTTMPRPATVGKNLAYGMNIINQGPDTATNVQVTDALPAGVTLVSASSNFIGGTPRPCTGTSTITCAIGTVGVGNLAGRPSSSSCNLRCLAHSVTQPRSRPAKMIPPEQQQGDAGQ